MLVFDDTKEVLEFELHAVPVIVIVEMPISPNLIPKNPVVFIMGFWQRYPGELRQDGERLAPADPKTPSW